MEVFTYARQTSGRATRGESSIDDEDNGNSCDVDSSSPGPVLWILKHNVNDLIARFSKIDMLTFYIVGRKSEVSILVQMGRSLVLDSTRSVWFGHWP